MPGPRVLVTTTETAQSAGTSLSTGTAFIVGAASYGPETPTLVRSLGEGVALYGPRSEAESTELYDALNTFFALGGAKAYVGRILGASIAAAKLELEAGATAKTLVATAKYKGTYGNSLKVKVTENVGKTASQLEILNSESEVLEVSGFLATATAIFEWGKTHEAYVVITEGSSYAAGKGSVLKELAATKLASGVNPTVTEATTKTAIETFGKSLGPGQLIVPATNGVKEGVHQAMGEHAVKNNRVAICDLKEAAKASTTVATLTGEKGTYTGGITGYMMFTASSCTVQGVTLGTTRTVPGSTVVAGLCAQVSRSSTSNNNQAPCGEPWPLNPFVLGFVNPYKQAEIEELSTAGINAFKEVNGIPTLFGFVSALSREKDLIFWQFSAARERMALVSAAEVIGNGYLFRNIDGRRRLISRFQGDLQGVIKEHWENNALFGETAPQAGIVNVGEPVNTLATIQAGELNAELIVRLSPFANEVRITIVSTPITEVV